MRITLPKFLKKFVKNTTKSTNRWKKSIAYQFRFLTTWKAFVVRRAKRMRKWFKKVGRRIVKISPPWLRTVGRIVWKPFRAMGMRIRRLLKRRPHRSFRRTLRRDYARSLSIQGYWSFTNYVRRTLWKNKRLFGALILTYFFLSIIVSGIGAQDAYSNLSKALTESGGDVFQGNWGKVGSAGLLLVTTVTTGLTPSVTQAQSVIGILMVFFAWTTTVWLLRNTLAGRRVIMRDGLYNGSSPLLSTLIVGMVLAVQLLPAAIAILLYNAAAVSGLLESGVAAMLFWTFDSLLVLLSIYWLSSTFIALIVVTLPGMYPFQAIRTAGDLVIGRRLRIIFRLLWLLVTIFVTWALVVIPIILFDDWIKKVFTAIAWVPIVPMTILLLSSITIIFATSYIYLLYRKVVEDDAKPA